MRTLERTTQFKRDYQREAKGPHRDYLERELTLVLDALVRDEPLAAKYRDHALTGPWKHFRDCHIRPDLILVYRKFAQEVLQLVRLGSHSELGF